MDCALVELMKNIIQGKCNVFVDTFISGLTYSEKLDEI